MRYGIFSAFVVILAILGFLFATFLPRTFGWLFAIIYLLGMVATAGASMWMFRKGQVTGTQFRVAQIAAQEAYRRRAGWLARPMRALGEVQAMLVWPINLLYGLFFGVMARDQKSALSATVLAQAVLPAWVQPAAFPAFGLMLIVSSGLDVSRWPVIAPAACLVAASVIGLLSANLVVPLRDTVLARAGHPKLTFIILLAFTFTGATLSHLLIDRWAGVANPTVRGAAFAILTLADVQTLLASRNISFATAYAEPSTLRTLLTAPWNEWLSAVIGVLFYFNFAKSAFDILKAVRGPEHHQTLGTAYAAIGESTRAIEHLSNAPDIRSAQLLLAAVRMRNGDWRGLERTTERLCRLIGADFSPREEAVLVTVATAGAVPLQGKELAAYLNHRADTLADPAFVSLLVVLLWGNVDPEQLFDALDEDSPLGEGPWLEAFLADLGGEGEQVEALLAQHDVSGLFEERLLRLIIQSSALLDMPSDKPVPDTAQARIDEDLAALSAMIDGKIEHWQALTLYVGLQRVKATQSYRFGSLPGSVAALLSRAVECVKESELMGEHVEMITAIDNRYMGEVSARLNARNVAQ